MPIRPTRLGAIQVSAKKPSTTEGMPARISSAGFSQARVLRLAYSARYTAAPSPRGPATTMAMPVTIREGTTMVGMS